MLAELFLTRGYSAGVASFVRCTQVPLMVAEDFSCSFTTIRTLLIYLGSKLIPSQSTDRSWSSGPPLSRLLPLLQPVFRLFVPFLGI